MPSKGRYTAGKQVSRWEADSDNIDIEYKNLESQAHSSSVCSIGNNKSLVIKILAVTCVFAVGLVLGYVVRKTMYAHEGMPVIVSAPSSDDNDTDVYAIKQDYDPAFSKVIQADLEDTFNYADHLKIISHHIHMSGVGSANKLLSYVEKKWETFPFDAVKVKKYNVTLSYANYTNMLANMVMVQAPNGTLVFQSQYNFSSAHPEYQPFSAYAPSGTVKTDRVVYAHYGRKEDFDTLSERNVSVNGSLLVVRYGKIHPASKVKNSEKRGALGVILYADPVDYTNNQSMVYPDTWWLPSWAVQLAHVRYDLVGDPFTPDYSSITGLHYRQESKAKFPKIPVLPIRYQDAKYILSDMSGPIVRNDWFGGLNITYRTGPGYTDTRKVELSVENIIQHRIITNIIAVIKGHYETDKYVIVGAHIDSWLHGAVDAGTGYTVIQELARSFAYHVGQGWKPRRTIMFALWDASKYGHLGSYEWVQEHEQELIAGAVAYINLDTLINGNYSFSVAASAMLHKLIMDAAQNVHYNCTNNDGCKPNTTLFDTWVNRFPDQDNFSIPRFEPMGDNSDHGPFIYRLGVQAMCPYFTYNKHLYPNLPTYPAYGTLDDSMEYMLRFIDPDYSLHITMAKVLADVILRLSDSAVLPFDILNFVKIVKHGMDLLREHVAVLDSVGICLDSLANAANEFNKAATSFNEKLQKLQSSHKDKFSEFDLYLLNDQLLKLPTAFIAATGLPGQPHYRNVLVAPDLNNLHTDIVFPGVIRTLKEGKTSEHWNTLNEQMSYLIIAFKRATDILQNGLIT